MANNKISMEDFSMDIIGDEELMSYNGGENVEAQAGGYSVGVACLTTNTPSITVSLVTVTSSAKCSNPANTYTEISCC